MSLTTYKNHSSLGLSSRLEDYGKLNPNQLGLGLRLFGKRLGQIVGGLVQGAINKVAAVVELGVPLVGGMLADSIRGFGVAVAEEIDLSFTQWGLNADAGPQIIVELTSAEALRIQQWYAKFLPYAENLTKEAVAALKLTDKQDMLTGLNAVLNKINAIQDHYAVTPELRMSQNAVDQRNALIYETFKVIHYTITEGVKALVDTSNLKSVQVTFPMNQYDFKPLFSGSIVATVTGENYKIVTGSISDGGTKNPSQPVKNPSLPIKYPNPGVITSPGTKPGVIPAVPVNTGGTPITSIPSKDSDKGNTTDNQVTDNGTDNGGGSTATGGNSNKSNTTNKVVIGGLGLLAVVLAARALTKRKPARRKQPGKKK